MVLRKISEVELNKYGSRGEVVEQDCKKEIQKCLDKIELKLIFLQKEVKILKAAFSLAVPSGQFIDETIVKINRGLKYIVHSLDYLGRFSGTSRKQYMGEDIEINFFQEKDHLHIEFPDLLPKRLDPKAAYTYKDLEAMYSPSFERSFKSNKHKIYGEKVIIVYTHFFSSEKEYIDHDNFETKIITDLIASYVLFDDSPKHCAILFDYKLGDKRHTEVDVYPMKSYIKDFKK